MEEEIKTIKSFVHDVLENDYKTRDSDTWLIFQVLREMGFKIFIDFKDFKKMPSFETITRCRRFIQHNEGKFPSKHKINDLRDQKREVFKTIYTNSWMS